MSMNNLIFKYLQSNLLTADQVQVARKVSQNGVRGMLNYQVPNSQL